jgi:hypothetical protein
MPIHNRDGCELGRCPSGAEKSATQEVGKRCKAKNQGADICAILRLYRNPTRFFFWRHVISLHGRLNRLEAERCYMPPRPDQFPLAPTMKPA